MTKREALQYLENGLYENIAYLDYVWNEMEEKPDGHRFHPVTRLYFILGIKECMGTSFPVNWTDKNSKMLQDMQDHIIENEDWATPAFFKRIFPKIYEQHKAHGVTEEILESEFFSNWCLAEYYIHHYAYNQKIDLSKLDPKWKGVKL